MTTAMETLLAAVGKVNNKKNYDDEKDYFYYPETDSVGNGAAVLRFLPSEDDTKAPFVRVFSHGFKNEHGKWVFIDNCPTTLGDGHTCPVCEENKVFYTNMSKEDARKKGFNRKTKFYSRILVVDDKKNPDNNGKVFMYSFGQKIFKKITDKLQPEFEDETPCDIFSLKSGANFKLKIRKVDGNANYDKSEFESSTKCDVDVFPQFTTDNDISLLVDSSKFKSYDALKAKLNKALGKSTSNVSSDLANQIKAQEDEFDNMGKDAAKPAKPSAKADTSNDDDEIAKILASLED